MTEEKVRIDKWLWAARFYKTRSMAAKAVTGGHVHVNGARVKAARSVGIGDELRIVRDEIEFVVIVQGLSEKRGPATVARTLYEETAESLASREKNSEERRLMHLGRDFPPPKRPGKRDRRLIRKFIKKSHQEEG
ncbi:MAG: RNA-binding S4 domain-containing protein [Deltaproteobacteria bacterium]|nr:RNA-binding S4 domain-containing protein [Deltaproteobacteria bacterium]